MRIRADFSEPVFVDTRAVDWIASPMPGVERKMLDRIGNEVARATSLVRYAPGSRFSSHTHEGGEEFFVLEGTFSDQYGDFPAGTYVRNPIGTAHAPHGEGGCVIWVKLYQFDPLDQEQKRIDTAKAPMRPTQTDGIQDLLLHAFGSEAVTIEKWAAGIALDSCKFTGGVEFVVLEGDLQCNGVAHSAGSWLRLPDHYPVCLSSLAGCRVLKKCGHLPESSHL